MLSVQLGDGNEWKITSISDNIVNALWMKIDCVEDILGKNISDLFDSSSACAIHNVIERSVLVESVDSSIVSKTNAVRNFQIIRLNSFEDDKEIILCCSVVACADKITFLIEFEHIDNKLMDLKIPNTSILQSGEVVGLIRSCNSVETVTSTYIDYVMSIFKGYDRGMVYKFEDDGSGHVIYENIQAGSTADSSYFNLRFPAEDIPPQAREIYIKTGVRYIYNVNGVDSKLISINNDRVDLTMICSRSPSKCHIQYLRNMGIVSSMSFGIIVDEMLWGLYTFHSYSALTKPCVEHRVMVEMIASITAMKIHASIRELHSSRKIKLNAILLSIQSYKSVNDFLVSNYNENLNLMGAHTLI